MICPVTHRICASRLHLPFLNDHGQHTCLSASSITWVSPEAKPPSTNRSFVRQAYAGLEWPGDLIPARGVTGAGREFEWAFRFDSQQGSTNRNAYGPSHSTLDAVSLILFEIPREAAVISRLGAEVCFI